MIIVIIDGYSGVPWTAGKNVEPKREKKRTEIRNRTQKSNH